MQRQQEQPLVEQEQPAQPLVEQEQPLDETGYQTEEEHRHLAGIAHRAMDIEDELRSSQFSQATTMEMEPFPIAEDLEVVPERPLDIINEIGNHFHMGDLD